MLNNNFEVVMKLQHINNSNIFWASTVKLEFGSTTNQRKLEHQCLTKTVKIDVTMFFSSITTNESCGNFFCL